MPSCSACGKWFSAEDKGCGCPGETVMLTRMELENVKRQAQIEVLEDVAREALANNCSTGPGFLYVYGHRISEWLRNRAAELRKESE